GRFVDEYFDDAQPLGVGERRVLARRAARAEEMDARVDLPPCEPANRRLVEIAAARERRHERRAHPRERPSHRRLLPAWPSRLPRLAFPPSCLGSRLPAFPPRISAFLPFCVPALRNTEYVFHCEPAAAAADPLCRDERAAGERRPI